MQPSSRHGTRQCSLGPRRQAELWVDGDRAILRRHPILKLTEIVGRKARELQQLGVSRIALDERLEADPRLDEVDRPTIDHRFERVEEGLVALS